MSYPVDLTPIFEHYITCEYASIAKSGSPITMPVTPYRNPSGTIDVSTGLVYPAKAERARRNPHVALLFSDAHGANIPDPLTVLVIGDATVRDHDLQANTDRYLRDSMVKLPDMMSGFPPFLVKMQAWYFVRIWIEVTPCKILWWRDTDQPPETWINPAPTAPPSDPAPAGAPPKAWKDSPQDWRTGADHAASALGVPVLTVVTDDGYPFPMRAKSVTRSTDGFTLTMPAGLPPGLYADKPACLTFHRHPEHFTGQENMLFVGHITGGSDARIQFQVDRRIVDWSGGGSGALSKIFGAISFLNAGVRLTPRLRREAERRGQPVPKINLP